MTFDKSFKFTLNNSDNLYSALVDESGVFQVSWDGYPNGAKYSSEVAFALMFNAHGGKLVTTPFDSIVKELMKETPIAEKSFTFKTLSNCREYICKPADEYGNCVITHADGKWIDEYPAHEVTRYTENGTWIVLKDGVPTIEKTDNLLQAIKNFTETTNAWVSVEGNKYILMTEFYEEYVVYSDEQLVKIMDSIKVLRGY